MKLALLAVYTVCLFVAGAWRALGVLALLLAVALGASRLPAGAMARTLIPLYFIMGFVVVFACVVPDPAAASAAYGVGGVSAGVLADAAPVPLAGGLFFYPPGFARALFYCVRVAAMVLASLLVAYSTPATQLTSAFAWCLAPLRRLGVPVDDIAFTFTLALRFIPLAFEELQQVRLAQMARGAAFQVGGLWTRMRAWLPVMVPWLVGLYRRAGRIALAMDVRAYGVAPSAAPAVSRTALNPLRLRPADALALAGGAACCVLPCLLLNG